MTNTYFEKCWKHRRCYAEPAVSHAFMTRNDKGSPMYTDASTEADHKQL